jgi:flagellar hook assembly protein FlgD
MKKTTIHMKTRSIVLAALLVVSASGAFANADPSNAALAVVSARGSEVVKVIYKGSNGKVKLNIYDASSKLVFTESRNVQQGFILPLNFAGLSAGTYTVELVDAAGVKSQKVNYQPAKEATAVHVVKLAQEGKFLLSVASATESVTIRIFDANNNVIHTSAKQAEGGFAQIFNIQNSEGGCTFEVTNAAGVSTLVRI